MVRYKSGEIVKESDLIRYRLDKWRSGKIKEIVPPGTRVVEDLVCREAGVFIEIDTDEGKTGFILETGEILDEDCIFVRRNQQQNPG